MGLLRSAATALFLQGFVLPSLSAGFLVRCFGGSFANGAAFTTDEIRR